MIITYEDIAKIRADNPAKSIVILKGTCEYAPQSQSTWRYSCCAGQMR